MRFVFMMLLLCAFLAWPLGSLPALAQTGAGTITKKPIQKRTAATDDSGRPDDRGGRGDRGGRPGPPPRSGAEKWRAGLDDLKYGMKPTDSLRYGVLPGRDDDGRRPHPPRPPRPPRPHPYWPTCVPYCPDVYYIDGGGDDDDDDDEYYQDQRAQPPAAPERDFQGGTFERFDPARDGDGTPYPQGPVRKKPGPDTSDLDRYQKMLDAWP